MSIRSTLRIRTRLRSVVYRIRPPEPKPLILMYHRIADEPVDPWCLCVTAPHFEQHLQVLRRTRYPLPLDEFVRALLAGALRSDAVAVTFDDGYFDNFDAGLPLLAAADVPATVFLATGYLNRPGEIWSDELAKIILAGTGPQAIEFVANQKSVRVERGVESPRRKDGSVRNPSKKQQAALIKVWEILRHLDEDERRTLMAELRSKFALENYPAIPGRAMTHDEVLVLAKSGPVTIGAHTVTHPVLPALDASACYREIKDSMLACEALTGASVRSFAYPYGRFDAKSREAAIAAGLAYACSTRHAPTLRTSDLFALPRLHVSNSHGGEFERSLRETSAA